MTGFLSKLFGGKSKSSESEIEVLIDDTLQGILERANFDLTYELRKLEDGAETLKVEFFGEDVEQLIEKF